MFETGPVVRPQGARSGSASDALKDGPMSSVIMELAGGGESGGDQAAPSSLKRMLLAGSRTDPHRPALLSADGNAISAQDLQTEISRATVALRHIGVGPDDRIAIVMPNGVALAQVFLSIAASAGCAPLNPSYSVDEFEFYLSDLQPRLLVTSGKAAPAAEIAAARLGIPVLDLPAGATLAEAIASSRRGETNGFAHGAITPDTVALYLHTSGTTARPKLVPLRHDNLVTSALNMVETLGLSHSDRCLNLMPLFHIHGLVGGLLAPLAGGGSAICTRPVRPGDFFRWMQATRPTWYTAVPAMHRMIVAEAAEYGALIARSPLRFIRSSSAPLPAQLFDELEGAFGCPVLEAYSMTEAAHQMTCNPTAPGRQRRGTVGVPAGPDVGIMDSSGNLLPRGEEGEIVIRGPSVMTGYVSNPEANANAFRDGWFRTGDQGHFDPAGYLVLSGRLKEQINRGGEKIAPLELDRVLLAHPGVLDVAAFGFPHPSLGEEVAAAVVLRPGASAAAIDLQEFMLKRVAPFKVPRRIVIVDAIPKGPTGKVQRGRLHKQLGLTGEGAVNRAAPERNPTGLEADLLRLWRELLRRDDIGLDDDFFEAGGDSLMAVDMLLGVEQLVGRQLPTSFLMEHPTVSRLAEALMAGADAQRSPLIELQAGASRPPLFFFHGDYDGGYYTRRLARLLGPDQPFYSIAPHGLDREPIPASIEAMAADRLPLLLRNEPGTRYRLGGYCNGGMVALETAKLLVAAGCQVDFVFIIDVPMINLRPVVQAVQVAARRIGALTPTGDARFPLLARTADAAWRQASNIPLYWRDPSLLRPLATKLAQRIRLGIGRRPAQSRPDAALRREFELARTYGRLLRKYTPSQTELQVVYFAAEQDGMIAKRLGPNVEIVDLPGGHWGCITTHADVLAGHVRTRLQSLDDNR